MWTLRKVDVTGSLSFAFQMTRAWGQYRRIYLRTELVACCLMCRGWCAHESIPSKQRRVAMNEVQGRRDFRGWVSMRAKQFALTKFVALANTMARPLKATCIH